MSVETPPDILAPLLWLEGSWGSKEPGTGSFPTINQFQYREELQIKFTGQPMLDFSSRTFHAVSNKLMHRETGFMKVNPDKKVGLVLSHNFGLTSVEEGNVEAENSLQLDSTYIGRIAFCKSPHVTSIRRRFELTESGTLLQTVYMETENTPLTKHLETEYVRTQ